MSKTSRMKRSNSATSRKEDNMADAVDNKPVHESKKVKAVTHDGVKVETQTVDAKFGGVEGSINYLRATALTPEGALAMAGSQGITKTVKDKDGNDTEVQLTDEEKFLKYFNAGYDAAMRITARNELAVIVEGPEKQINAIALRIGKHRGITGTDEEIIKGAKALPGFDTLLQLMG